MLATPPSFDAALATLKAAGDRLRDEPMGMVAVCLPGIVDESGEVLALPGKLPGAEGRNVRQWLSQAFGLPATVTNDAIAYGAGEAILGAGRGHRRVVVVTLGTGVGVAVFDGGKPAGSGPYGGGILGGQMPIDRPDPRYSDSSDRSGTIEALCRAQRLVDYAAEEGSQATTPEAVIAEFGRQAAAAAAGVERFRGHLVRALVALAHAHAPGALIVGGGPAGPGSPLLEGIEARVNAQLFGGFSTRVLPAEGGDSAALLGLACLAAPG
ncbi:MAG: ROK family protein [Candidatus Dormibacteria bacterium]